MINRRNGPKRRARALVAAAAAAVAAVAVIAAFVLPASSSDSKVVAAGKPSTTTSSSTTTAPPPYANVSITIGGLTFTYSRTSLTLSGSFVVKNASDRGVGVTVVNQYITLQYKTSKTGAYTSLPAPSCTFSPSTSYAIPWNQSQTVTFTCTNVAVPADAKYLKVTVHVQIAGRTTDFTYSADQAV
ncbi:MAG TPA: hypothetical protein VFJ85_16415 [Acidimicrobiales bacterium]|nr:hypothetical protein [Acidimicrobiales bacterium]